jgi:hypothetical protein
MCLRVSFGLSLLFVGIAHYMTMGSFVGMVSGGLGALSMLGTLWAYILPGLMIVGGGLLAINMHREIATWAAGLALASIPAGMLLKPLLGPAALPEVMPMAINAFIWLIIYMLVIKCSSGCCSSGGGGGQ